MFLVVNLPPRSSARLLLCFSRRRRGRRRAATFRGGLHLGLGFPVWFGIDLGGRWRDASVARRSSRVRLVEPAALEDDAYRVEDARDRRPTLGALRQWRVGGGLSDLELGAAAAAGSVNGHGDLTYNRILG